MARKQTAEEIKQWHLGIFGDDLGLVFHELYAEVVWLHIKWDQLQRLFKHSKARTRIIQETAPEFFTMVRRVLVDDILLHIIKLTDNIGRKNNRNLTLWRLPELIEDPKLRQLIVDDLQIIENQREPIRTLRNKYLAHFDLDFVLASHTLKGSIKINDENIDCVLKRIARILNHLYRVKANHKMLFEDIPVNDDVEALIAYLQIGLRCDKKRLG